MEDNKLTELEDYLFKVNEERNEYIKKLQDIIIDLLLIDNPGLLIYFVDINFKKGTAYNCKNIKTALECNIPRAKQLYLSYLDAVNKE